MVVLSYGDSDELVENIWKDCQVIGGMFKWIFQ